MSAHGTPIPMTAHASGPLTGVAEVPGDKSISHRAVMFAGIAEGKTTIHNFLDGHDCRATVEIMRDLGVQIDIGFAG